MRPYKEAIPDLTTGSLLKAYADIRSKPLADRQEPDWKEVADALQAELTARGEAVLSIDW